MPDAESACAAALGFFLEAPAPSVYDAAAATALKSCGMPILAAAKTLEPRALVTVTYFDHGYAKFLVDKFVPTCLTMGLRNILGVALSSTAQVASLRALSGTMGVAIAYSPAYEAYVEGQRVPHPRGEGSKLTSKWLAFGTIRLLIIQRLLRAQRQVLLVEMDVLLFRPPVPLLINASFDVASLTCRLQHVHIRHNLGFQWYRPTARSVDFISAVTLAVLRGRCQNASAVQWGTSPNGRPQPHQCSDGYQCCNPGWDQMEWNHYFNFYRACDDHGSTGRLTVPTPWRSAEHARFPWPDVADVSRSDGVTARGGGGQCANAGQLKGLFIEMCHHASKAPASLTFTDGSVIGRLARKVHAEGLKVEEATMASGYIGAHLMSVPSKMRAMALATLIARPNAGDSQLAHKPIANSTGAAREREAAAQYLLLEMPALPFATMVGTQDEATPNQALLLLFTVSRLLGRTPLVPLAHRGTQSRKLLTPTTEACFSLHRLEECSGFVPAALITSGGFGKHTASPRRISLVAWAELMNSLAPQIPHPNAMPAAEPAWVAGSDLIVVRIGELSDSWQANASGADMCSGLDTAAQEWGRRPRNLSDCSRESLLQWAIPSGNVTKAWEDALRLANQHLLKFFANDTHEARGCVHGQGFRKSCLAVWQAESLSIG